MLAPYASKASQVSFPQDMVYSLRNIVFLTSLPCAIASAIEFIGPPLLSNPFGSPTPPGSSGFQLREGIVGVDFYRFFDWQTFDDPTHGRVNYVDKSTAQQRNLTMATPETFIIRADDTNIVPPGARGRDSNRISSLDSYEDSILVLDVKHMPWGCATWPAFWTVHQDNWPEGGEIDIIEGVNRGMANQATLHTTSGCQMDVTRTQTGSTISTDCNAYVNHNQGCATSFSKPNSYGADFNAAGGGWYVMKRTQTDGVYVWFFGRNDPSVPAEVRDGSSIINPDQTWGNPEARFPSTDRCDFAAHFDSHKIIFDTTFCGDWAGGEFGSSCGPGTCEEFVNNNPQEFQEAYWEINALRVYVPN